MFRTIKWGQGFQKQSLKSKQNSRGFSFANNTAITFWVNLSFNSKLVLGYSINVLSYYVCIKLFMPPAEAIRRIVVLSLIRAGTVNTFSLLPLVSKNWSSK